MSPQNDNYHRRSIRLQDYDYSQEGAYFVTICTHRKQCLFGEVVDGQMKLNEIGKIAEKCWNKLPDKFSHVVLDEYIIMPNHIHGIVVVVGADPRVGPNNIQKAGAHTGAPLPKIIQWFKTMSTNEHLRQAKNNNISVASSKLWQRNYYEHVIRNEIDLHDIQEYIVNNPSKWDMDEYHIN